MANARDSVRRLRVKEAQKNRMTVEKALVPVVHAKTAIRRSPVRLNAVQYQVHCSSSIDHTVSQVARERGHQRKPRAEGMNRRQTEKATLPVVYAKTAMRKSPGLLNAVQQCMHSRSNHYALKESYQLSGTRDECDSRKVSRKNASAAVRTQHLSARAEHSRLNVHGWHILQYEGLDLNDHQSLWRKEPRKRAKARRARLPKRCCHTSHCRMEAASSVQKGKRGMHHGCIAVAQVSVGNERGDAPQ